MYHAEGLEDGEDEQGCLGFHISSARVVLRTWLLVSWSMRPCCIHAYWRYEIPVAARGDIICFVSCAWSSNVRHALRRLGVTGMN